MSPSAVTIGVDTESRSHPRRYERTDRPTVTDQDEDRAERTADHRDRDQAPDGDGRLAERRGGDLGEHGEPEGRRQRRHHCDVDVLVEDALPAEAHFERSRGVRRSQASPDRAEDRATHADRGRDEDDEAGERRQGVADTGKRQPGDEPRDRAEDERDQTLPERSTLGSQGPEQARGTARDGHNGTLMGSSLRSCRGSAWSFDPGGPRPVWLARKAWTTLLRSPNRGSRTTRTPSRHGRRSARTAAGSVRRSRSSCPRDARTSAVSTNRGSTRSSGRSSS